MVKEFTLPEIAENVESGNVVSILVSPGDVVEEEQGIIEIETDKATAEVPAVTAGTIKEIRVQEGQEVSVGEVIATVETEADGGGESVESKSGKKGDGGDEHRTDDETGRGEAQSADTERTEAERAKTESDVARGDGPGNTSEGEAVAAGGSVPAAPSTRRLAREVGVDITGVSGSGPAGRILAEDVKRAARLRRGGRDSGGGSPGTQMGTGSMLHHGEDWATKMSSGFSLSDFTQWGAVHREKLPTVRRITGENTQTAWQTIPHVTHYDEADASAIEAFRTRFAKQAEKEGVKITVTAIILKVVARALKRFPRFNASLDPAAGEIIYKDYVNVSVAADTDRGLLVPVVRDVDTASIISIAASLADLAERARNGKLKPEEMQGGTFTVSNLGGIGGTGFSPVVFAPQVAILGVARTHTKPVWNGDAFVPRPVIPLSVSYDHRVVDGADGARFLRWVVTALEEPLFMDLEGEGHHG